MARRIKFLEGAPQFQVLNALDGVVFDGDPTSLQSTSVTITAGNAIRLVFKGSFDVTGGMVNSGTADGFDLYFGATRVMKATGFAATVAAVDNAFAAPTIETFLKLFSVNAKVVGSKANDLIYGFDGSKVKGKAGDDNLVALDGAAHINGGDGNDVIHGNGASRLAGGPGDDLFFFDDPTGGNDRISDFSVKDDVVAIPQGDFQELPLGYLNASRFHVGKAAKTPDQHLIYDKHSGALYYDKDGSGPQGEVVLVHLDDHLKFKADNLFVTDFL